MKIGDCGLLSLDVSVCHS